MTYATATAWVAQMSLSESGAGFLGVQWQLPASSTDLATLYADAGYTGGRPSFGNTGFRAGPFTDLQPNFVMLYAVP
jgi:hypothetical protein